MTDREIADNYMAGFSKVAEAHGVDPEELAKQAGIASTIGSLLKNMKGVNKRVIAKLSPKLDEKKLNAFTRLFTTTKTRPVGLAGEIINDLYTGVNGGIVLPLMRLFKANPKKIKELEKAIKTNAILRKFPNHSRTVTRLSPGRVLAGTGVAGAGTYGGIKGIQGISNLLGGDESESVEKSAGVLAGFKPVGKDIARLYKRILAKTSPKVSTETVNRIYNSPLTLLELLIKERKVKGLVKKTYQGTGFEPGTMKEFPFSYTVTERVPWTTKRVDPLRVLAGAGVVGGTGAAATQGIKKLVDLLKNRDE